jgi:hypothetical protein
MAGTVYKGVILSIQGYSAKVAPQNNMNLVTRPLVIPEHLRNIEITKGTIVVYAVFEDTTGIILSIMN